MKTTVITHQANLKLWTSRISDQKASGLLVDEWCTQNGVSRHQFYYWKRQLKEACLDSLLPDIVPITVPAMAQTPDNTSCTTRTTFTTNPIIRITLLGRSASKIKGLLWEGDGFLLHSPCVISSGSASAYEQTA